MKLIKILGVALMLTVTSNSWPVTTFPVKPQLKDTAIQNTPTKIQADKIALALQKVVTIENEADIASAELAGEIEQMREKWLDDFIDMIIGAGKTNLKGTKPNPGIITAGAKPKVGQPAKKSNAIKLTATPKALKLIDQLSKLDQQIDSLIDSVKSDILLAPPEYGARVMALEYGRWLRKNVMALRTEILASDPECKGDMIKDGLLWKYLDNFLRKDYGGALFYLTKIQNELTCVSARQAAVADQASFEGLNTIAASVPSLMDKLASPTGGTKYKYSYTVLTDAAKSGVPATLLNKAKLGEMTTIFKTAFLNIGNLMFDANKYKWSPWQQFYCDNAVMLNAAYPYDFGVWFYNPHEGTLQAVKYEPTPVADFVPECESSKAPVLDNSFTLYGANLADMLKYICPTVANGPAVPAALQLGSTFLNSIGDPMKIGDAGNALIDFVAYGNYDVNSYCGGGASPAGSTSGSVTCSVSSSGGGMAKKCVSQPIVNLPGGSGDPMAATSGQQQGSGSAGLSTLTSKSPQMVDMLRLRAASVCNNMIGDTGSGQIDKVKAQKKYKNGNSVEVHGDSEWDKKMKKQEKENEAKEEAAKKAAEKDWEKIEAGFKEQGYELTEKQHQSYIDGVKNASVKGYGGIVRKDKNGKEIGSANGWANGGDIYISYGAAGESQTYEHEFIHAGLMNAGINGTDLEVQGKDGPVTVSAGHYATWLAGAGSGKTPSMDDMASCTAYMLWGAGAYKCESADVGGWGDDKDKPCWPNCGDKGNQMAGGGGGGGSGGGGGMSPTAMTGGPGGPDYGPDSPKEPGDTLCSVGGGPTFNPLMLMGYMLPDVNPAEFVKALPVWMQQNFQNPGGMQNKK